MWPRETLPVSHRNNEMQMVAPKKMHYTFLLPSSAFGGLEMQMVNRAADAIQRGESSLFVGRPNRPAGGHALSLGIPVETLEVKRDYVDLIAAYHVGKMLRSSGSNVCVVGESNQLSLAILARKLVVSVPDRDKECKQAGFPVKFSNFKPTYRFAGADIGAHTREVLDQGGFSSNEIQKLVDNKVVFLAPDGLTLSTQNKME